MTTEAQKALNKAYQITPRIPGSKLLQGLSK